MGIIILIWNGWGERRKGKEILASFPYSKILLIQTKIKKIIQENQDIGKLSNLVPPLVEQSLEFFLVDLLKKCEEVAQEHSITKLTPQVLKKALHSL